MTDPQEIPGQVTETLGSIWSDYAGSPPSEVRTRINGNVLTCVLVGGVDAFNSNLAAAEPIHKPGTGRPTSRAYKQEVVAAIVRLTGKGVAAFSSSHDTDTDIATETFTLKPAPSKRKAGGQLAHAFWLSPLPPCRVEDDD